MKVYKIRHIPSGLFFKPSKHGSKSNLSKKGKLYDTKPSLGYLSNIYHHPVTKDEWELQYGKHSYNHYYEGYVDRPVVLTDWEIVEFNLSDND